MMLVLVALLFAAPSPDACIAPARAPVSKLKRQAEAAFQVGNNIQAADQWQQAAELYPLCARTYRLRIDNIRRSLNALERTHGPSTACGSPELRAARLVQRTHAELLTLPDATPGVGDARSDFANRLAAFPEPVRAAAVFLDDHAPPVSAEASLATYTRVVAAVGACPALRAALLRHVLALLPQTPDAPACDSASEAARKLLGDAMTAMEKVEPDTAASTAEYAALRERLSQLREDGKTLAQARARATTTIELDDRAEAWATVARGLPTCSAYLAAKQEAALAAVAAWNRKGIHQASATERFKLADEFLADTLTDIEADYGPQALELPEHKALTLERDSLVAPSTPPVKPTPLPLETPKKKQKPPPSAAALWMRHLRPERNIVELGLLGGLEFPASHTHQLSGVVDWQPYRKMNPSFGVRLAWFPLSFLGGELEGGIMPTRVLEGSGETPGARAMLFNLRGHIVAQLPFWRITPFVMIGGGLLGTRGALGNDVDPSLNVGGGVKAYLTRHFMLRLDVREVRSYSQDRHGTNYPEVLLGLSVTLNRRRDKAPGSETSPKRGPRR